MSVNMHLWFEAQNIPENKKEQFYDKAVKFFQDENLLSELTIEWQGKRKNMFVAFEKHPVVFAGSGNSVGEIEKDWVQMVKEVVGDTCKAFFSHGFAD